MVDGRMLDGLLVRLYLALVHFAPRNVLLGHPSFGPTAPRIFDADASKQFLNTQWASDSDLLARAQLVWQEELKAHQVAYFIIHHEGVSAHYSTVCVDWRYGEIVSYDSLGRLPPIFQDKVTSSLATLGLDPPLEWRHVTDTRQAFYSYSKVFCEEVGDDVRRKLFLDIVMKRAIDLSPSCRLGNELPATNIIHDMRKPNASSTESWTISSGSEREVVDLMDTSSDTEDE
ncbi:hypothetical protein BCR44DRAFT_75097 [Catenaria anguillulae PL171]|uniref:Uncharacterized protein n=1 Tax=Catenaria anguillulae PL171 TaxID=765915 RepID=A0A1Y2H6F3_9FUNG|nr:hypothetical protein BCR44DRAFT_75097 [Catenaria anguillulae PL171]